MTTRSGLSIVTTLFLFAGCASAPPVATSSELLALPRMSPYTARKTVVELLQEARIPPVTRAPRPKKISFPRGELAVVVEMQPHDWGVGGNVFPCSIPFDRLNGIEIYSPDDGKSFALSQSVFRIVTAENFGCFWYWNTKDKARDFANALLSLRAAEAAPDPAQRLTEFRERVKAWPKSPGPFALPDEAKRQKALAEAAFRELRFEDAIDLYGKALEIAPWWAELYYNRALLIGELGFPADALLEMRKYLTLRPAEASRVQDKIYVWEAKAGGP